MLRNRKFVLKLLESAGGALFRLSPMADTLCQRSILFVTATLGVFLDLVAGVVVAGAVHGVGASDGAAAGAFAVAGVGPGTTLAALVSRASSRSLRALQSHSAINPLSRRLTSGP